MDTETDVISACSPLQLSLGHQAPEVRVIPCTPINIHGEQSFAASTHRTMDMETDVISACSPLQLSLGHQAPEVRVIPCTPINIHGEQSFAASTPMIVGNETPSSVSSIYMNRSCNSFATVVDQNDTSNANEDITSSPQDIRLNLTQPPAGAPVSELFSVMVANLGLTEKKKKLSPALAVMSSTKPSCPGERKRSRSPVPSNVKDYGLPPEKSNRLDDNGTRVKCHSTVKIEPFKSIVYKRKDDDFKCQTSEVQIFEANNRAYRLRRSVVRTPNNKTSVTSGIIPYLKDGECVSRTPSGHGLPLFPKISSPKVSNFNPFSFMARDGKKKPLNDIIPAAPKFCARPATVLQKKAFIPEKSQKGPTVTAPPQLLTEKRAFEREQYENYVKELTAERAEALKKRQEEEQKREAEEMKIQRAKTVHKPRHIPASISHPFEVKKSDKPLTDPLSPHSYQATKTVHKPRHAPAFHPFEVKKSDKPLTDPLSPHSYRDRYNEKTMK